MARAHALLLTHSEDVYTVDRVAAALGRGAVRLNTDRLGIDWHVEGSKLHGRAQTVDLARVRSVWARRTWPPSAGWLDCLDALHGARWVNPPSAEQRAECKPLQLRLAAQLQLPVPPTLITDRLAAVRTFHRTHGRLITKLLRPTVVSMQAHPDFAYTTELWPRDYRSKARFAPQIFQPLLLKEREVRLVVVARRLFAGSIDSRSSKTGWLDWRRITPADGIAWQHTKVPGPIATAVRRMMRALGLVYGAFDFVVLPKNRWVFLEVNPAGEYGWLERDLGLPISQAIAEALQ